MVSKTLNVKDKMDPLYQKRLICNRCQMYFCAECGELWHGNQTCETAQAQRVKLCPQCNAATVRYTACNKMQCHCQYKFCWICNQPYNDNHYKPWNFKGCPGGEHQYDVFGMRNTRFKAMILSIACAPCLFGGCLCFKVCSSNKLLDATESSMASCL